MILLWGLTGDSPFDAVCAALQRRKARYFLINQRHVLETRVELHLDDHLHVRAEVRGAELQLDDVGAAYWRTYDLRRLPAVVEATPYELAVNTAAAVEEALATWLEMSTGRIMNRPSNMASNGSKPYQMETLRTIGFDVPATLVTTDPATVRRFWTEHGTVIYKSLSGTRSVVRRLSLEHLSRIDDVAWCPTQFQQYVPGADYRVHVIGDDVFACEVISEADDYRYGALRGQPPEIRAATLPADISERCLSLTRALGLRLSGIDLRHAPDGRWFCFEVNPSPGFTYYEAHTAQPIADAIASDLDSAFP